MATYKLKGTRETKAGSPRAVASGSQSRPRQPEKRANRLEQDALRSSAVLKLVGDPVRMHVVLALSEGERDAEALRQISGRSGPVINHHLAVLSQGELIVVHRAAHPRTYRLTELGAQIAQLSQAITPRKTVPKRTGPPPKRIDAALLKDVAGFVDDPELWFQTPNASFENRRPIDLLGTPEEGRLRNRIKGAKLGMFS